MVALTCRKQLIALSLKEKPHVHNPLPQPQINSARQKEEKEETAANGTNPIAPGLRK